MHACRAAELCYDMLSQLEVTTSPGKNARATQLAALRRNVVGPMLQAACKPKVGWKGMRLPIGLRSATVYCRRIAAIDSFGSRCALLHAATGTLFVPNLEAATVTCGTAVQNS